MALQKCLNCGGERIVPQIKIEDNTQHGAGHLELAIYADPEAVVFKETHNIRLRGDLCCDCGYVHVFAVQDLSEVWKLYEKHKHEWNRQP